MARHIKIMAVVKAQAYGHGLREVALEAIRDGVDYLGVARVDEGIELREAGIEIPILVFEIASPDALSVALKNRLELTVSSLEGARELGEIAAKQRSRARIHIKVDTGMGRLGFPFEDAVTAMVEIARHPTIEIAGVYSHFATAEGPDLEFARLQLERFTTVLKKAEQLRIPVGLRHMANSGAIIALPESHFDLVRPGIMLYGYLPRAELSLPQPLVPVMSLRSKVRFVKSVGPETSISYGRRYSTAGETRIATIPVGYGDGFPRALTNKANVLIRGKRYPCVGTICMDQLMVNIGQEGDVALGDDVTLIGRDGDEQITCWDIARVLDTIPYEITCLITPRVKRIYLR